MIDTSENQIKSMLKEAYRYEKDGLLDDARKCYLKCVALDDGAIPKDGKDFDKMKDIFLAWLSYASFLKDQNNWEEAIQSLERALIYTPLKPYAFTILGQCHQAMGKHKKAEEAFRQSIELKPRPEVWIFLYDLLHNDFNNRTEEAIECLYSALDINPDYEEAHFNLGYYFETKREYITAKEHFRRAVEIDPKYARAYAELAFTLILENKSKGGGKPSKEIYERAENYLMTSIECDPSYGWSRCYLANCLWAQRKIRKAHEQYRELVKIWPDFSLSHWALGDFLACENINTDDAEFHLKKAVELEPEDDVAHYHLGKALFKWKRNIEAKIELEKASELGNTNAMKLLDEI